MNKNPANKIILQIAAVIVIIGAIIYLEANKPHNSAATAQDISPSTSTSTPVGSGIAALAATDAAAGFPKAKEITDPTGFINSPNGSANGMPGSAPFTLSQFAGNKVILLDFWTYSCINCERTIPYLNAWYAKYKDAGLVIVGVHTPEFDFEKDYANVAAAVEQYGIRYPVGIVDPSNAVSMDPTEVQSPETYFGAARNEYLANGIQGAVGSQTLSIPGTDLVNPAENSLYLEGQWNFQPQYAESAGPSAKIIYNYDAKNVYMVAAASSTQQSRPGGNPVTVNIKLDGVSQGSMTIQANKLYNIIQGSGYGEHTLELDVEGPGLDAYTFTFG